LRIIYEGDLSDKEEHSRGCTKKLLEKQEKMSQPVKIAVPTPESKQEAHNGV